MNTHGHTWKCILCCPLLLAWSDVQGIFPVAPRGKHDAETKQNQGMCWMGGKPGSRTVPCQGQHSGFKAWQTPVWLVRLGAGWSLWVPPDWGDSVNLNLDSVVLLVEILRAITKIQNWQKSPTELGFFVFFYVHQHRKGTKPHLSSAIFFQSFTQFPGPWLTSELSLGQPGIRIWHLSTVPCGPKADPHPLGLQFNSFVSMPLPVVCFPCFITFPITLQNQELTSPCWLCFILTSKNTGQLLCILQTKKKKKRQKFHSRNGIKQNQCLQGGERKTLKNPNPSLSKPVKLQQEESPTLPGTDWSKRHEKTKPLLGILL